MRYPAARSCQPGPGHRLCGDVPQVQQRDPNSGLDLVRDLVHRVGADQQQVRTGGLESFGRFGQQLAGFVPPPGDLQCLHVGEVHRRQHDPSRVQPTSRRRAPRDWT